MDKLDKIYNFLDKEGKDYTLFDNGFNGDRADHIYIEGSKYDVEVCIDKDKDYYMLNTVHKARLDRYGVEDATGNEKNRKTVKGIINYIKKYS